MEISNVKIVRMYDLVPVDGRKSFYGKAKVVLDDKGFEYLMSYETLVAFKDANGGVHRCYEDWSYTTGRHIKAFCGMNKAMFSKLPVEP